MDRNPSAPVVPDDLRRQIDRLIGSTSALLTHINPSAVAEDFSCQWLAVNDQINIVRDALSAATSVAPPAEPSGDERPQPVVHHVSGQGSGDRWFAGADDVDTYLRQLVRDGRGYTYRAVPLPTTPEALCELMAAGPRKQKGATAAEVAAIRASILGVVTQNPYRPQVKGRAERAARQPAARMKAEDIARIISSSSSYGEDPDDDAPRSKICGPNSEVMPNWRAYEEQAEAILSAVLRMAPLR